jgi:hypothetical protein
VFSRTWAVLRNIAALVLVPLKSNFGSFAAFEPSALLRNFTWAFSSFVTTFKKAAACGLSDKLAALAPL